MITKIGIENYKIFSSYTEIKLKPITILTGPNGSGKSSISKFLLLLKNLFDKKEFIYPNEIFFNTDNTLHENYQSVLSKNSNKKELSFSIFLNNIDGHKNIKLNFTFNQKDKTKKSVGYLTNRISQIKCFSDDILLFTFIFDKPWTYTHCPLIKFEYHNLYSYFVKYISENRTRILEGRKYYSLDDLLEENEALDEEASNNDAPGNDIFSKQAEEFNQAIKTHLYSLHKSPDKLLEEDIKQRFLLSDYALDKILDIYKKYKSKDIVVDQLIEQAPSLIEKRELVYNVVDDILELPRIGVKSSDLINCFQENAKDINRITLEVPDIFASIIEEYFSSSKNKESNTLNYVTSILSLFLLFKDESQGLIIFLRFIAGLYSTFDDYIKQYFFDLTYVPSIKTNFNDQIFIKFHYQVIKETYKNQAIIDSIKQFPTANHNIMPIDARKWIQKFKIADDFHFEENLNSPLSLIFTKNGLDFKLSELGYGASQFALLILMLSNKEFSFFQQKTCIIEEPETSLHPDFQSNLAELFVDSYKSNGTNFIIETHSEYLIRKLQYLTAKGKVNKDDIVIYYFDDPNKQSDEVVQLREIQIDNDGKLSQNFGAGFFDEADNIAIQLLILNQETNN